MEIIKLKPAFLEKMWGGQDLTKMGYSIPKDKNIGEAWIISALPQGMSYLEEGPHKGEALKDFFENNRNLFGNYQGQFPLLVKILDANKNLSVQVHPDDAYAKAHNNSLGKPESWYVLDCPKDAEIIYGHNAKTEDQLKDMVAKGEWNDLLRKVPVKPGDFLYTGAGKIHGITPGVIVYELQRSSDVTYRFYDYDRVDPKTGQKRQLDIEDSIAVTKVPDSPDEIVRNADNMTWSNSGFSLYVLNTNEETEFSASKVNESPYWLQFTVVKGQGTINGEPFKESESAIGVGNIDSVKFTGDMKVLISWIKK